MHYHSFTEMILIWKTNYFLAYQVRTGKQIIQISQVNAHKYTFCLDTVGQGRTDSIHFIWHSFQHAETLTVGIVSAFDGEAWMATCLKHSSAGVLKGLSRECTILRVRNILFTRLSTHGRASNWIRTAQVVYYETKICTHFSWKLSPHYFPIIFWIYLSLKM